MDGLENRSIDGPFKKVVVGILRPIIKCCQNRVRVASATAIY